MDSSTRSGRPKSKAPKAPEESPDSEHLRRVVASLESPLRLRLVSEFMSLEEETITLEDAAVRTACPEQDVAACLRPMVPMGILESLEDGARWRLHPNLSGETLELLRRVVEDRARELERDRHVRHQLLAGLVGRDPKMQLVTEMVRKVSRLDVPVFITGETGTGKELVARAIHDLSRRSSGFFGDVNCATLTESLFESHVFGHARGAFTGAVRANAGLIERCAGGTLFLDEIGELTIENQVKLLKVLQSKTFMRVGETVVRFSDFRLVSATNRHLPVMIAAGGYREDLYYRINVFPIAIPALRERLDDLPYLVDEIVSKNLSRLGQKKRVPRLTGAALEHLKGYDWPGNIRELENVVVRAMIAAGGDDITPHHLPTLAGSADTPVAKSRPQAHRSLAAVERDHILLVLDELDGNIRAAAELLAISRTTLYRKMREHGIDIVRTARVGARSSG